MVNVTIGASSKETGALLVEMLTAEGLYDRRAAATVCYGAPSHSSPSLNSACSTDKIERLRRMERHEVSTIPWSTTGDGLEFPLLARTAWGFGGTDIVPVFQPEELAWRRAAGYDWFSSYVPVAAEYRVWSFRGAHLGTYEKVLTRPEEYKFIGRNFRNGFEFRVVPEVFKASHLAHRACTAVGLDFAAVDMLLGKDGRLYVLELNTAPGVIRSGAQDSLHRLVGCIRTWVSAGYPKGLWQRP
jgi:hypothetical protein